MSRAIGYKCKTPGCEAWFKICDMPENTARTVHFVLRLEQMPTRLQCPDCGEAHDYSAADKEEFQLV